MPPKNLESQAPAPPADPASAQRLFASMASTTGSGKPCSKEVSPQVIPFSGAGTRTLGGGSACPVGGGSSSGSGEGGGCPVMIDKGGEDADDARNLMPAAAAAPGFNAPSANQATPLPTARQASSIPMSPEVDVPEHQKKKKKEEEEETASTSTSKGQRGEKEEAAEAKWVYPSQQMFFNAMLRKGWSPAEQDMESVVAIHNAVNERAWQEVVAWETAAGFGPRNSPCGGPRLAKFVGRPRDLSPKARVLNLLGYRLPFDRHDWFVDRCGKERVRYVIDFYNAAAAAVPPTSSTSSTSSNSQPSLLPAPVSMHLDVRPALDSPGAAWERLKAAVGRVAARWN